MAISDDALGYYAVLNVQSDADVSLIKRHYYQLAKDWHPDHNEAPNALEMFQKVSVAYDVLKEASTRLQYDLLSAIYERKDFPTLGSLKIYKNQAGKDDAALRVLKQRIVKATFKGAKVEERKDICNFREASAMVLNTSIINWLRGWWAKDGWQKTWAALKYNYHSVYATDSDNLKLLVHNAIAYLQENNVQMAWIYANQALILAQMHGNFRLQSLLNDFISKLNFKPQKTVRLPRWQAQELKHRQWLIPAVGLAAIIAFFIALAALNGKLNFTHQAQSYYQEREFAGGALMSYDMIDSQIMKADSDINSTQYLYHLRRACPIYYGPDDRYDQMTTGAENQTVRVVGWTVDKKWYKIVIDNGEMGFVHYSHLNKGMGNPVPMRSRVYQN